MRRSVKPILRQFQRLSVTISDVVAKVVVAETRRKKLFDKLEDGLIFCHPRVRTYWHITDTSTANYSKLLAAMLAQSANRLLPRAAAGVKVGRRIADKMVAD